MLEFGARITLQITNLYPSNWQIWNSPPRNDSIYFNKGTHSLDGESEMVYILGYSMHCVASHFMWRALKSGVNTLYAQYCGNSQGKSCIPSLIAHTRLGFASSGTLSREDSKSRGIPNPRMAAAIHANLVSSASLVAFACSNVSRIFRAEFAWDFSLPRQQLGRNMKLYVASHSYFQEGRVNFFNRGPKLIWNFILEMKIPWAKFVEYEGKILLALFSSSHCEILRYFSFLNYVTALGYEYN